MKKNISIFTNTNFPYVTNLKNLSRNLNIKNTKKYSSNKIISLKNTNKIKLFHKANSFGIKYSNENLNNTNPEGEKQKTNKNFYNDIYEEFTFKENPYLNKKEFIDSDAKEKANVSKSVNLYVEKYKEEHMDGLEINEILDLITKMLISNNQDTDLWYKILNQFNELLCDNSVSKKEIIIFLELLSHFKPKVLEKDILPKNVTQIESEILFSKKHEEEYFRLTAPKDIFGQFALNIKKNLTLNLFSKLFKMSDKFSNREDTSENIDDLLGLYMTLFRNIELKITDDIANGRVPYNHSECVTFIKSFSIAQEGTNMLFELLMRKVIKHFNELTLPELECILNYLPHELYNNKEFNVDSEEKYVETGRTKSVSEFYENSYNKVLQGITEVSNELFLNLFQGCLKIKFVDIEVIGSFLLEFDNRVASYYDNLKEVNPKENKSQDIKKFVLDFMQILTYFIRNDIEEIFLGSIDYDILWKSLYDSFLISNLNKFNLKEISTLFWTMYHFKSITNDKIKFFEKRIEEILQAYLKDPKSNIDDMGYETHLRYYDNYDIDEYDVEAIKFFIETNKEYKGDLINILKKTLECISLENTHPISRKLFNF